MHFTILISTLAMATAMPSYIAVPADQIAFVDLSDLRVRRVPRQTLSPPPLPNLYSQEYQPVPIPIQQYSQDPIGLVPPAQPEAPARLVRLQQPQDTSGAASLSPAPQSEALVTVPQIPDRPPDFGEFVDFGAHTGDNGAFGWYADYPVNNHHDSHDHDHYKK